jgi:hypothetical protein
MIHPYDLIFHLSGIRPAAFHPPGAARSNASSVLGLPDADDMLCDVYFRDRSAT